MAEPSNDSRFKWPRLTLVAGKLWINLRDKKFCKELNEPKMRLWGKASTSCIGRHYLIVYTWVLNFFSKSSNYLNPVFPSPFWLPYLLILSTLFFPMFVQGTRLSLIMYTKWNGLLSCDFNARHKVSLAIQVLIPSPDKLIMS